MNRSALIIPLASLTIGIVAFVCNAIITVRAVSPDFTIRLSRLFAPPPERPPLAQLTPEQKAYFKKRARFHGLLDGRTVVYDFPDNPYFIRNGKRCKF